MTVTLLVLIFLAIAAAYTALVALVFSLLTIVLGMVSHDFEVEGVDEWDGGTFWGFYWRYSIVAAVYVLVGPPLVFVMGLGGMILGILALSLAYQRVFGAGLKQAFIIGAVGGLIASTIFLPVLEYVVFPLVRILE